MIFKGKYLNGKRWNGDLIEYDWEDGQIIFLYVAGRLYLKKRPKNAILYGTVVIYKKF